MRKYLPVVFDFYQAARKIHEILAVILRLEVLQV